MAKWIEYLLKKKPADEDMLMLEDAETHNNKRVSFSGIADWLIEKMKKNNLISGALRFKGSSAYAALPGKGAAENDYYYCSDGDGTHGPGYYAWNGSSWIWIGNNDKGIDKSLKVEGAAAEAAATGEAIASLKEDIYNRIKKTLSNDDFVWENGWYENDGTIHNHEYFKHSKVFKTVQNSTITFKNLRAPANYIACIACFSGGKYMHDVSLKGDSYMDFSSGTFTVPENVDGVSFVSYFINDASNITANLMTVETKSDSHEKKILELEKTNEKIENQLNENTENAKKVIDINTAITIKKNETFSGKDIEWINGFYGEDGTITSHAYYKHTGVLKVEPGTKVTYAYLRSPTNFSPYIACFKNGVYTKESSLLGDTDANFKSGEFTIPQNIDGISFASYDAPNDERLSIAGIFLYYKPDINAEKIESIETNIQHMESDIAGNYNQIYNIKKYTIADGIDVKGKYYDKNGKLQLAYNLSTTGIFAIPYGIKSIEYTAMRNIEIPTILFFGADMGIVGTVIAATAPVYGDTMYSGIAEIPSNAIYMEFSVSNANNDSSVTVMYSNIESNQKRIEILEKDPLYGKKITCTGNSITAAIHSVPGHGYVEQIADAHGMTVDNHAIWGAIIPQGHPRASGDVTDIGWIHGTLDDMDAGADIVIMSGSINDCEYYNDASFLGEITGDFSSELDSTTFYGALEDMCKKALQKWAGKPIIYVIEHRMTLDNTTYGQFYLKLHKAIIEVMNKWGISIVDLFNDCPSLNYNNSYREKYTTGDGTHPNYEGYEKFYVPRVYAEIKKLLG